MSEVNGRLCTCDRCGETVFRKFIGIGETDGGFTTWDKFEPYPEGWDSHYDIGTLCPICSAEYNRILREFKENVRTFMEEGEDD